MCEECGKEAEHIICSGGEVYQVCDDCLKGSMTND
jgi:hypothetical protein